MGEALTVAAVFLTALGFVSLIGGAFMLLIGIWIEKCDRDCCDE